VAASKLKLVTRLVPFLLSRELRLDWLIPPDAVRPASDMLLPPEHRPARVTPVALAFLFVRFRALMARCR
jgi:hypothetical protein